MATRALAHARRVPVAALALIAASIVTACGGGGGARNEGPFAYDAGRPLSTEDRGVVDDDYPIAVHDVSYVSGEDTVDAFLSKPPGSARRPAVVYVHGAGSTRDSMIGPALWLAARGAVTLALTAPSSTASAPAVTGALDRLRWQRALEIRDVTAVRRAADLLAERDDVDPRRIGFVGWSAGARAGAILAGVEPRLQARVLISCGTAPVSDFVRAAPAELRPQVEETMSSIDPLRYIAQARPGSLLL
ncbi:MAG: alpha/beta hydrolase family protein, partial [Gaiellaceae bacterium]